MQASSDASEVDGPEPKKPGPQEERLKVKGDWKAAMRKAISKEKPPDGWPDSTDDEEVEEDDAEEEHADEN